MNDSGHKNATKILAYEDCIPQIVTFLNTLAIETIVTRATSSMATWVAKVRPPHTAFY